MTETEFGSEQQLEAFREMMAQEIAVQVEIFPDPDIPYISLDPYSLLLDERLEPELSPEEKRVIGEVVYKQLGIDAQKIDQYLVSQYHLSPNNEGEEPIPVYMYKTNRTDECGLHLHEIHHHDGERSWVLAAGDESWVYSQSDDPDE